VWAAIDPPPPLFNDPMCDHINHSAILLVPIYGGIIIVVADCKVGKSPATITHKKKQPYI
jgi:hypothetical protein